MPHCDTCGTFVNTSATVWDCPNPYCRESPYYLKAPERLNEVLAHKSLGERLNAAIKEQRNPLHPSGGYPPLWPLHDKPMSESWPFPPSPASEPMGPPAPKKVIRRPKPGRTHGDRKREIALLQAVLNGEDIEMRVSPTDKWQHCEYGDPLEMIGTIVRDADSGMPMEYRAKPEMASRVMTGHRSDSGEPVFLMWANEQEAREYYSDRRFKPLHMWHFQFEPDTLAMEQFEEMKL